MSKQQPTSSARQRRHILFATLTLIILQCALADPFHLRLDGSDEPYCKGGLELLSLQVECEGPNDACDFGYDVRLSGSIVSRQTLTRSASVDVIAFLDDVTARHLSQSSNVDLCNFVNSTDSGNNNKEASSCTSGNTLGKTFAFGITYNINYVDGTDGWWFRYSDKIAVEIEITDTTSTDDFSAACRMVLIVKHVYEVSGNFPSSPQYYRLLYWGFLGLATMASGFWIGYSVRRKCRVVCLEDLQRIVGDCENDRYTTGSANVEMKQRRQHPDDTDESIEHDSPAFQIMTDPPLCGTMASERGTSRIPNH